MSANVVVLISGRGSNLKSIIDAKLDINIAAIISNKPNAMGLKFAKLINADQHIIDHTKYSSRESFDAELIKVIDGYQPKLVILAGFMRILTTKFVKHFENRLLNIHPSLLPKYKGVNTHQRALDAGDTTHGATVHFVTDELDSGFIIKQVSVKIEDGDTKSTLEKRVLMAEHKLYPEAIKLVLDGKKPT